MRSVTAVRFPQFPALCSTLSGQDGQKTSLHCHCVLSPAVVERRVKSLVWKPPLSPSDVSLAVASGS